MTNFNIDGEVWKQIANGNYLISNHGHLASYWYNHKKRQRTFRRLKLESNYNKKSRKKVGYYVHTIYDGHGNFKTRYIHRLVAKAFIPNPHHYPTVNHIDGNHFNNNVDNLEWCTYSRNNKLSYDTDLHSSLKDNPKVCFKVFAYLPDGRLRYRFKSMRDGERALHLANDTVSRAVHHHWLYDGMFWYRKMMSPKRVRYLIRHFKHINWIRHFSHEMKPVSQYTKDGKYIATYPSCSYAGKKLYGRKKRGSSISRVALGKRKSYKGFIWKFNK